MSSPSKIHVVTRAYLAGWAVHGLLRPVHVVYGRQKPKSPAGVGWRAEWWGQADPGLNDCCEKACGKLETVIPDVLATLARQWPSDRQTRALLAQFIALHILRSPSFPQWFAEVRESSLPKYRDDFANEEAYGRFLAVMRTDRERARRIFGMVNKMATMIASMQWTRLHFDEPILITGDQPVCPVPLIASGETVPITGMPSGGMIEVVELRFPVSPRIALVGTWYDGPDVALAGTWEQAVNLNASVRALADLHWFQSMEAEPALPPAIYREPVTSFNPVSPWVLPGYGSGAARNSRLRAETQRQIDRLVQRQDSRTMAIVAREFRTAA